MRERPSSSFKGKGNSLPPLKTTMAADTVRILRIPFSPLFTNPSGGATLRKKAYAAGVKLIILNERVWNFYSDIRTFRTTAVFCLKGRFGPSRNDRVKVTFRVGMRDESYSKQFEYKQLFGDITSTDASIFVASLVPVEVLWNRDEQKHTGLRIIHDRVLDILDQYDSSSFSYLDILDQYDSSSFSYLDILDQYDSSSFSYLDILDQYDSSSFSYRYKFRNKKLYM
ncbi:hypothetical protein AVEN_225596-1 [Araneus ventricosus]|uniref:Uncharacterized protein n=1 Tax=Araneus ventricosus TaxID=182803 RepID=A0A4Y2F0M9_ARAVE|nr:hypothetical protein AVEN_225596-1 [Araneus ventricosus]